LYFSPKGTEVIIPRRRGWEGNVAQIASQDVYKNTANFREQILYKQR